jgi:hypothetical protein
MKKIIILILITGPLFFFNNCKKSSEDKFTTITVDYTTNITQSQCFGGGNAFCCIYFDVIDPVAGRVSRRTIHDLQSSGTFQLEMGPQTNPHYCFGSQGGCTAEDRIHYQVGKTYEYKAYLVCDCSSIGQCGTDFQYLGDGTSNPVKLLTSGTIKLDKKEEKNKIQVTLIH